MFLIKSGKSQGEINWILLSQIKDIISIYKRYKKRRGGKEKDNIKKD